jgi:hypothetical protein
VSWLVACCYLLGALIVTVRLWPDPAHRVQLGDVEDVNMFAWFARYAATAVAHVRIPALVTTALNAPRGVSVMWNTSFLLPGILLSPVTLLAGPQVSLTIALTLSIAGSAASLFWVLRRWGASISGAALGGAVYGFSPALLNSGVGHYNFVLAVLPPLIIDALLRIVTGRGSVSPRGDDLPSTPRRGASSAFMSVRTGAWMGLLAAAQLFIGEEALIDTAIAGLVLVVVTALGHRRAVRERARDAALGVATGIGVALLLCAYPLWVQFRGPLHEHNVLQRPWSGNLGLFVDPSSSLLFHTSASEAVIMHYNHGLAEVLAYLGWPMIVVLVTAAIRFWRDPRVRAAAVTCVTLEVFNLGGGDLAIGGFRWSGALLPYHWLQGLPVMGQVIPSRFCILGAGAAGAVLAFSLDLARSAAPRDKAWRRTVPAALALVAVLPLIPLPYRVAPVRPVPAGWQETFARLHLVSGARVLVVPVPLIGATAAMRWQADSGEPGSLIGGYFIGPSKTGEAVFSIGPTQDAAAYLNRLSAGQARFHRPALVRSALNYWRPAAVVAATAPGSRLGQFLVSLLGQPTFRIRSLLVWRR